MERENPLSKRLRRFDNPTITHRPKYSAGIYITSNEERSNIIAEQLAEIPLISQGCHIGFSGWHNLDIMALRRSSLGIICDHNPENALFLGLTLNILLKSANIDQYIQKMSHFVDAYNFDTLKLQIGSSLDYSMKFSSNFRSDSDCITPSGEIRQHLRVNTGWLATEERFQFIKQLAHSDRIVVLTEEILATEAFIKMRKLLQENGVQIDTLYLSNISAYMYSTEARDAFLETISALSENETNIIDARGDYYLQNQDLAQRLTTSRLLLDSDKAVQWWWGQETIEEFLQRETPEERSKRKEKYKGFFKNFELQNEDNPVSLPSYQGLDHNPSGS